MHQEGSDFRFLPLFQRHKLHFKNMKVGGQVKVPLNHEKTIEVLNHYQSACINIWTSGCEQMKNITPYLVKIWETLKMNIDTFEILCGASGFNPLINQYQNATKLTRHESKHLVLVWSKNGPQEDKVVPNICNHMHLMHLVNNKIP